jgi:regulator of protease activity HflC (stomatin/prohibitin superfamily)
MNIDKLLELLTFFVWLLLTFVVLILFAMTARQQGIKAAFSTVFSYWWVLIAFLLAVALSVVSASLVFIPPEKVGVVVSLVASRGYRDQPLESGRHWIFPLAEEVVLYPISFQTYTMSSNPLDGQELGDDSVHARTKDGQEIALNCSVIFRIDPEQVVRIHIDWQNRYTQDLIRPQTRGLIRTEVSKWGVDQVNSDKREDLEDNLDHGLQEILEDKGFILDDFVLRNISFSPEYAAAVEQKQVALQGVTQTEHEAMQIQNLASGRAEAIKTIAEAERAAEIARADGEAQARILKAQAEAQALSVVSIPLAQNPNLLLYRYISALAPNIKVMLLPNNAPFLFSLPSLNEQGDLLAPPTSPTLTSTLTITPTTLPTTTIIVPPPGP